MLLRFQLVSDWPKLAWVAQMCDGSGEIAVLHGPMVELGDNWLIEAVWDGDFASADFDRSDLIFGTGIRVRENRVVFVSSASGVDRLWHCRDNDKWFVSNSLPAILAVSGLALREDYLDYLWDLMTVELLGIKRYSKWLPASPAKIGIVYFDNLVFDGRTLETEGKHHVAREFGDFNAYRNFLVATARSLGQNLADRQRRFTITPLTAISKGYDSPAVSVIAKHAGCVQAATIINASSVLTRSDDGSAIAQRLGLDCRRYVRKPSAYRREETIWAAAGHAGGLNLTLFDYPKPLCLFFSGSFGDKVWDAAEHDLSEPIGDCDCQLGEYRLLEGVFHTVVPWWGIRQAQQINRLGGQAEMKPWSIGGVYDRPVPRRIVEEEGIPRNEFGLRKLVTASNMPVRWPCSTTLRQRYRNYLKDRRHSTPPDWALSVLTSVAHIDNLVYKNTLKRWGIKRRRRPWMKHPAFNLLFQWANDELKKHYQQGLRGAKLGFSCAEPAAP